MVSPKKLYSFWITDGQATALKTIKRAKDISESEQIRRALEDWLEKNKATLRKSERERARTRKRP